MAPGLVMRLGYAPYILGVKPFYAASAGSRCTDLRAGFLTVAGESIKLSRPSRREGLRALGRRRGESLRDGSLRPISHKIRLTSVWISQPIRRKP
jgi:hypothetical protein